MHIICTATALDGRITHHLVHTETGAMAYRALKPLISPGSTIDTASIPEYMRRNTTLPEILIDHRGRHRRTELVIPKELIALGERAAANPEDFWNHYDGDPPL